MENPVLVSHKKAEQAIKKEFELRQEQRRQNREVAAFNQGMFIRLSLMALNFL